MLGQTLKDRYKIIDRLGKGAMGTVYRATDIQTGQDVALKIISSDLLVDPEMLERFKREGEALGRLKHPNIVSFLGSFEHGEHHVIVMEFVPGGSLLDLIKAGPLSMERIRQIALDLCDALIRAHKLNIIHRDLKPDNILIDVDGTPKLADFGVARLNEGTRMTRSGTQVGTPYYMSPEAWRGETLDAQADIWSLGVILFEMLSGKVPFDGDTGPAVMTKVFTTPVPDLKKLRSGIPSSLVKIISRMLAREKTRRYQTIRQVGVDLEGTEFGIAPTAGKVKEASRGYAALFSLRNVSVVVIVGIIIALYALYPSPNRAATTSTASVTPEFTNEASDAATLQTEVPSPASESQTTCPETAAESGTPDGVTEVAFDYPPNGALACALQGYYAGTTVTVNGTFEANDPDGMKFAASMEAFENATNITVTYIGNSDFEASLATRVRAGNAPDIAALPHPGLLANFVRSSDIVPIDFISDEWLAQQYHPGWREYNTIDGVEAAVMHRYFAKSLVWYPKKAWDDAGYQVPQTWDDLLLLTQQIADDGDTAWCIGIESGGATGWVATDWTEDLMLRTTSLENYDAWTAGSLPFDSPEVRNAIELWSDIWFNDAYVRGGRSSITSTRFGDAPAGMFEDPPQCWLHRQANFIAEFFFPEGAEFGVDYDFFYLPPVDNSYGRPFLIGGDLIAMFNDRPEVRALMEYFTIPQSVSGWLEGGGAIAAHQTATQDMFNSELDWSISQLVSQATSFRFDGSDLMPAEVGASSFFEHISSYVAGTEDLDTALQAIDASWPP